MPDLTFSSVQWQACLSSQFFMLGEEIEALDVMQLSMGDHEMVMH